ncbi:MAG: asparagine synthase (glutamine-hydrolyzing) [Acidobacteriia bacterium]|nr:asparagine synthase (glutamine-hydrolyzing) [Terriglobia bacterium]
MCGICGTAGFADRAQLEAMNCALIHRGPDDGGVEILSGPSGSPWIGLGNRRLSVIDLSPAGHQPMSNEDGKVRITYNGEIFNFPELRPALESQGHQFRSRTDTEVLVHLYEQHGIDFVNRLNGMFALALWDSQEQRLLLARDPFGIKPLYYLPLEGGRLAFASEVKCFLESGLLKPEIDEESLHCYLNFLWTPGPKTLFKGVFKLMPGHVLLWRHGQIEVRNYWDGRPSSENQKKSERELTEELRELLFAAVKRHLISDVPLGVFLSGGLDSSSLLALGTRAANRSMKAYTITFRSEDARFEQSDEDRKYARQVAKQFGAEHHEIEVHPDIVDLLPKVVWHLDEPVADPSAINSYLICKAAREHLTVMLSGQGGDEIFGGYRVHLQDRFSKPLAILPGFVRQGLMLPLWNSLPRFKERIPGVRPGKIMAFHRYFRKTLQVANYPPAERYMWHRSYYSPGEISTMYAPDFWNRVKSLDVGKSYQTYFQQVAGHDFVDQMLYVDQKTFLPELNLTVCDKTSMAASIEARVPLLDQELTAFMRRIPARYKIRGLKQKYLFKRAMEGILPHRVIWRPKAAFGAPVRSWLRRELREMVHDLLSEESVRRRGIFDPVGVEQMIRAHEKGEADSPLQIWALLTLEIWAKTFLDRGPKNRSFKP